MSKFNHNLLTISIFTAMLVVVSSASHSLAYASTHNDKVGVNCVDVAITLATLDIALGALDENGKSSVDASLDEALIAKNVDDVRENFQNVLDTVNGKCEKVDFLGFVDFE